MSMLAHDSQAPGAREAQHELCMERDGVELSVLPLHDGEEVTIGRGFDCTIALDDDLVSRRHARIVLSGGELRVEDSSTNGTLAGGLLLRHQAGQVPLERPMKHGASLVSGTSRKTPARAARRKDFKASNTTTAIVRKTAYWTWK